MTLGELKARIAALQRCRDAPIEAQLAHAAGFCAAERDAWKAAFEWRVAFTERWREEDALVRERDRDTWIAEEQEGMRLIREHLA